MCEAIRGASDKTSKGPFPLTSSACMGQESVIHTFGV